MKYDPIQETFQKLYPASDENNGSEATCGALIIFHGAPYTQIIQNGNRGALYLNLQVNRKCNVVLSERA